MQQDTNDRERQYRLDAAMFAWTLAFRRWQADDTKPFPILRPFADGLSPEDAVRLMDYALSAIIDGLPEPMSADEEPETLIGELSPAGERALAAIRAHVTGHPAQRREAQQRQQQQRRQTAQQTAKEA